MTRRAELPGIPLRTEHRQQILEGIAQPLGMVVGELVDHLEEHLERLRVAIRQIGVLEDASEQQRDAGIVRHLGDGFRIQVQRLMPAQAGTHELGPAVFRKLLGEEFPLAAELFGLGVHVVHELVDQRDGDLLDLGFWVGHFADEDVAGGVDAAFGGGVEH